MPKLITTIIDPIDLVRRVHEQISALVKKEISTETPNLTRIDALWEANDILINTLGQMTNKASEEINEQHGKKAR